MPGVRRNRRFGAAGAIAFAVIALVLTGCSSSKSSTTTSSPASSAPATSSASAPAAAAPGASSAPADALTAAQAAVAAAEKGVFGTVPSSAPKATPQSVWVVSCGQQAIGCALEAGGAMTGGAALGWKMHLCDGKFDTDGAWDSCVRQAIAAKATGIILDGIDCGAIKAPLTEAKAAGIKTTSTHDFDCDDPTVGSAPLYSTNVQFLPNATSAAAYWTAVGAAGADYLIAQTQGKAQVLDLTFPEVTYTRYLDQGLTAELAKCSGCKIVDKLNLSVQDQATNQVPTKLSAALLKNPTANAMSVPFDSLFPFGVRQAIIASGRASSITVLGGEGEPPNMPFIKSNQGENAVVATDETWCGWAGVDELNRAFAGQPAVPEGIGYQLLTSTNLPLTSAGAYQNPTDYVSAYKAAWGV